MELLVENVLNIGDDEFYRTDRYKLPLTLILINTKDEHAFDILNTNTRQTDIIQQLSSSMIVVFLTHTNFENSKKFMQKIEKMITLTYTAAEYKHNSSDFVRELFLKNLEESEKYD